MLAPENVKWFFQFLIHYAFAQLAVDIDQNLQRHRAVSLRQHGFLVYINICCFIITVLSGQDWYYHSIYRPNSTPKTSMRRKDLGDLLYMLPILCQISLPWQRALIARPQQPPTRCKDLDDISCTNWVIVYFISNFVAMATEVGREWICLTAFNSPTPKKPLLCARI